MTGATARRLLLAGVAGAAWLAFEATPGVAACHAFEVNAEPATVAEGGGVQVTVSRDADVAPSQIDVETIDGSARAGADYTAVARRTITFTEGTAQTFPVQTADDSEREAPETFRIHLSNPGGCAVNPNFTVGPDATVTIAASDDGAPPPTTAGGGAATTAGRPGTTRPTPSSTAPPQADLGSTTAPPTLPPIPEATTDTTFGVSTTRGEEIALAEEDDGGGAGTAAVIIALAAAAAVGGAGWWRWRRRVAPPT